MIIFCAYQLSQWCATGSLLYVPRIGHQTRLWFREEPWLFAFMAFIYSSGLLPAGYAAVLGLFAKRRNE
jgi:hypothetical protein